MELQVTGQNENVLLSRHEVTARVQFEGATPKRKDIQTALAKQLKVKEPKTVVIKTVKTEYGSTFATVHAHAYTDEKAMFALERKNLLAKHEGHEDLLPKEEE